jgi:hypothetical protein
VDTPEYWVEKADYIANADRWTGDRVEDVREALLRSIALSLIALTSAANSIAKATYTAAGP